MGEKDKPKITYVRPSTLLHTRISGQSSWLLAEDELVAAHIAAMKEEFTLYAWRMRLFFVVFNFFPPSAGISIDCLVKYLPLSQIMRGFNGTSSLLGSFVP